MDQIVNQAAKVRYQFGGKAKVPLTIRTAHGGGAGFAAQHSQSLEAIFTHIPGLKVVIPATPYDAKGLLKVRLGTMVVKIDAKDVVLDLLRRVQADGFTYQAVEFHGNVGALSIEDRFVIANMGIEMGGKLGL